MEPSKGVRGGARTKSVGTKLTEEEFARIDVLAAGSGRTLSEWIRERLLGAASGQASSVAPGLAPVPVAGDGARVADEVLLSEVLALRAILLNLLYDMATGEALDEERMKALIWRGDADKREKAKVRLYGGEDSRRDRGRPLAGHQHRFDQRRRHQQSGEFSPSTAVGAQSPVLIKGSHHDPERFHCRHRAG